MNPKVSIMIPIWNVEKFIVKCAESLFDQTFDDIEYIFVNDCSPDNSIKILKELIAVKYRDKKERIKIIEHKYNMGIAGVRNTCIRNASGDYLLFVDSDDWIEPDMIELLYNKAIEQHADIACCDIFVEYKNNTIAQKTNYAVSKEDLIGDAISQRFDIGLWKLLVKSEVYKRNGLQFDTDLKVGEDSVICLKLLYFADKIAKVDKALYHYVQYNDCHLSKINAKNITQWAKAICRIEEFCRNENIYDKYKHQIYLRKFIYKKPLILDKNIRDLDEWRKIMPESNGYWKYVPMGRLEKLLFISADKNWRFAFALIGKL